MPDNPTGKDAGNKMRTIQLLNYFTSRADSIELDFAIEQFWSQWAEKDLGLFTEKFPDISLHVLSRKVSKKNKSGYLFRYKLPQFLLSGKRLFRKPALPDLNTHLLQKAFNKLVQQKHYDYIIISYVTWASLVRNNPFVKGSKLINDTHDFITGQIKDKKSVRLGKAFEQEMKRLSLFDEIWSVSTDEQYLFSQFCKADQRLVPIMFDRNYERKPKDTGYSYDLICIGSKNEHNIKSFNWFFEKVYPLLPEEIRICVIGQVCQFVPDNKNVYKIPFAEHLDAYYFQSKVAICPMLSGTGVKVKTVEALSYGLPVVCTQRGLDGLPWKEHNGCLRGDDPSSFAKHILSLLNDDGLYQETKTQGIQLFNRYFEKTQCYQHLDQAFSIPHYPRPTSHL